MTLQIHHLTVGLLHTNCFVWIDEATREAWVIDPGGHAPDILHILRTQHARLTRILLTHAHFDHLLAAPDILAETSAQLFMHPADQPILARTPQTVRAWLGWEWGPPPTVDGFLHHGDILTLGDVSFEVRHVPGHSPGSVIFVDQVGRRAWVGDTVFREGMGRTDLPGGDYRQLLQAIHAHILSLPDDFTLYPGHGPSTTVGHERHHNPFISPDLWVG